MALYQSITSGTDRAAVLRSGCEDDVDVMGTTGGPVTKPPLKCLLIHVSHAARCQRVFPKALESRHLGPNSRLFSYHSVTSAYAKPHDSSLHTMWTQQPSTPPMKANINLSKRWWVSMTSSKYSALSLYLTFNCCHVHISHCCYSWCA